MILNIDADLLPEILLHLPAKSLIRFKSVCKEWLALISSDDFCHQHTLRRPKPQQSLILRSRCGSSFYFNPTSEGPLIPYNIGVPGHEILQACNGLMLLGSCIKRCCILDYYVYDPTATYYVYNPTTTRSRKITLTDSDGYSYVAGIGLAFDPLESPYYKIVCFRTRSDPRLLPYLVEVYGSESHTWRSLASSVKIPSGLGGGIYWNNSIYWVFDEECYECFDFAKDEMRTLVSPPFSPLLSPPYEDSLYEGIEGINYYSHESNGHLFHYQVMFGPECESVVVWELGGDDHSKWLLRHHHVLRQEGGGPFRPRIWRSEEGEVMHGSACILRLMEDEAKRVSLIYGTGNGTISAYNFLDKSYGEHVDITSQPLYTLDESSHQFGESLALV